MCTYMLPWWFSNKESVWNAGDPGSFPGPGRSFGEGIGYLLRYSWASLVAQLVKKPSHNVGDLGSIPELGGSPGGGIVNPLQYSCLENPHGQKCLVHGVTQGQKLLNDYESMQIMLMNFI